jgi:hypothetical protein
MEIRADGSWFYNGTPIGRPEMVRLFASILKREGDAYFLVTPVEKVGIRVVDAPFLAVDADIGAEITFTTNVGDQVTAGPDHPIEMRGTLDAPRPYVHIRRSLGTDRPQDILPTGRCGYARPKRAYGSALGRGGLSSGDLNMARFAANLTYLFTELPMLQRFAAARAPVSTGSRSCFPMICRPRS